ncbi:MAG: glycosyltransferase family 2 protein [Spirochaetes bacterium]|nr:glycosyltransferase family 2 protein [Spirochaetota bacterium]
MKKRVSLTIVLPCHNEEELIENTYNVLKKFIDAWKKEIISDYEIVMVNNGSTDNTLNKMIKIHEKDNKVVILDLRRNYGFQGSLTAGVYNATKDVVVTIDADLQDDPGKIKEMILKYYEGYDLVLGVRESRKNDTFFKRFTAQTYYKFLKFLGIQSVYNHGDFRLISRSLLEDFKKFNERNRYIRSMIFEMESKFALVYYKREKRNAGKSKFNFSSLISLGMEGITSFSNKPIRLVFFIGIFMFLLSIAGIAYGFISKFVFGLKVAGWTSTFIIISLFSGMQNLLLGIVGEYISKVYIEVKQRPLFLIRKIYKKGKIKNHFNTSSTRRIP